MKSIMVFIHFPPPNIKLLSRMEKKDPLFVETRKYSLHQYSRLLSIHYKQEALDTVLYANHDGKRAVRVLKSHAKQIFSSLLLRDYNYILVYGVCQTERYVFNLIRSYQYNTQNLLYHVEMLMVNTFCSVCISLTQKHPIFVRINLLLFHLI